MQNSKCSTACANGFSAVSRDGYYVECCVDKTVRKEGDACPHTNRLELERLSEYIRNAPIMPETNATVTIWNAMNNMNNYQKGQKETMQESNTERHRNVCRELNALYDRKNRDYGDSFHETYQKGGIKTAWLRIHDKFRRFENVVLGKKVPNIASETMRDTLIDMCNYIIMTVMELDAESNTNQCEWVKEDAQKE